MKQTPDLALKDGDLLPITPRGLEFILTGNTLAVTAAMEGLTVADYSDGKVLDYSQGWGMRWRSAESCGPGLVDGWREMLWQRVQS